MLNFGVTNYWADAGRAAILFAATFAYPINAFPARLAVSSLARLSLDRPLFYYGITLGIFVLNLGVALLGMLSSDPSASSLDGLLGHWLHMCCVCDLHLPRPFGLPYPQQGDSRPVFYPLTPDPLSSRPS